MHDTGEKRPRVLIQTLGCKVNQYDSERLRTLLLQRGYLSARDSDEDAPDLIIVNTCSVTSESDRKGRQLIRKLIRHHPQARVMVTGCYAQRKPGEIENISGVDEVVPIEAQEQWAERLAEILGWGCKDQDALWDLGGGIDIFEEHTRAFVKIQDGCELKCTFCSIPASRGRARSRSIPEVLAECRNLIRRGYPEIVLCGVCLGHFGKGQDFDLADLLREMIELDGIRRIRISSLEPQDVTDPLLDMMAGASEPLCPHLHLPLQSGSNAVLRRMKRPYTFDFFLERIERARKLLPHFEISTDIMVGFPGETDADFEQTLQSVALCRFSKVHAFRFSVREETPAARMKGHLSPQEIEARRQALDTVALEIAQQVKQAYIGITLPVLNETAESQNGTGFTPNYLRADFRSPRPLARGDVVPVRFTSLEKGRLQGIAD